MQPLQYKQVVWICFYILSVNTFRPLPFFFTLNENRYFTIISVYSSRFVKIYIKYNY